MVHAINKGGGECVMWACLPRKIFKMDSLRHILVHFQPNIMRKIVHQNPLVSSYVGQPTDVYF